MEELATRVLEDLLAEPGSATVAALRGEKRFELTFRPMPLPEPEPDRPALREGGVCLITGGFGGIGLSVAETLVRESPGGRGSWPTGPPSRWSGRAGPGGGWWRGAGGRRGPTGTRICAAMVPTIR